jgi:hypothetical protein
VFSRDGGAEEIVGPLRKGSDGKPATAVEYADIVMNRYRQLGALVLLLIWSLVPAMACALPDAQMTPAERSCCVQMQQHCGGMSMPASHGCCQKQVRTEQLAAVYKNQHLSQPIAVAQALPVMQMAPPPSRARVSHSPNASPPQSPPFSVAILRI